MTAKAATGAAASEAGGAADTTPKPDAATGAAAAGKTSSDGAAPDGQPKADEAKTGDEQKETQSGKTDDSKKAGGDEVKDQKKAPATYELTVPDDAKRFVTDADLERFQEIAKANDWTQEEAAAALTEEVTNAQERQTASSCTAAIAAWEAETKADKTYGGKNLPETQRLANLAIDRVYPKGHPERDPFLAFLKESGGGVNLRAVKFFANLGRMMGEDTPSSGRSTSSSSAEKADKFYDHPTSKRVAEEAAKA